MARVPVIKKIILERRAKLIYDLYTEEGFSDIDIGDMFNMDRTWIYRIRKTYERGQKKGRGR